MTVAVGQAEGSTGGPVAKKGSESRVCSQDRLLSPGHALRSCRVRSVSPLCSGRRAVVLLWPCWPQVTLSRTFCFEGWDQGGQRWPLGRCCPRATQWMPSQLEVHC